MSDDNNILDQNLGEAKPAVRRRKLLPWWIKAFIWLFMLMGLVAPLAFVLGLSDFKFTISLYGLSTSNPISVVGVLLTALYVLKGLTAFGLWTEKDWAINIALIDGIIGLIICIASMTVIHYLAGYEGQKSIFRLEIILLLPYLARLKKIKKEWEFEN